MLFKSHLDIHFKHTWELAWGIECNLRDSRFRSEALLKFEGYNDVQITTLFLNWLPTVT